MQAQAEKIFVTSPIDRNRIKRLVEDAAEKQGGFRQLATTMDVHPQLVSNWRNGVKTPSPEAQADLAVIAGRDALVAGLMALIEKSEGKRRVRLQSAYHQWMKRQPANMANLYLPTTREILVPGVAHTQNGTTRNTVANAPNIGQLINRVEPGQVHLH